jgi:hypothetical protein
VPGGPRHSRVRLQRLDAAPVAERWPSGLRRTLGNPPGGARRRALDCDKRYRFKHLARIASRASIAVNQCRSRESIGSRHGLRHDCRASKADAFPGAILQCRLVRRSPAGQALTCSALNRRLARAIPLWRPSAIAPQADDSRDGPFSLERSQPSPNGGPASPRPSHVVSPNSRGHMSTDINARPLLFYRAEVDERMASPRAVEPHAIITSLVVHACCLLCLCDSARCIPRFR